MHAENPREPAHDPLLQPVHLKHLRLKNRVMSTAHEPAYSEDGMPKDRYRAYHVEKAKGGLAMTMTAGTAVVSPDSPPAFGNLFAYDDAIVPWVRRMTDEIHEHDCAAMIQISHLGRRTGWGQDAWLPVVAPSALREPAAIDSTTGTAATCGASAAHASRICCGLTASTTTSLAMASVSGAA